MQQFLGALVGSHLSGVAPSIDKLLLLPSLESFSPSRVSLRVSSLSLRATGDNNNNSKGLTGKELAAVTLGGTPGDSLQFSSNTSGNSGNSAGSGASADAAGGSRSGGSGGLRPRTRIKAASVMPSPTTIDAKGGSPSFQDDGRDVVDDNEVDYNDNDGEEGLRRPPAPSPPSGEGAMLAWPASKSPETAMSSPAARNLGASRRGAGESFAGAASREAAGGGKGLRFSSRARARGRQAGVPATGGAVAGSRRAVAAVSGRRAGGMFAQRESSSSSLSPGGLASPGLSSPGLSSQGSKSSSPSPPAYDSLGSPSTEHDAGSTTGHVEAASMDTPTAAAAAGEPSRPVTQEHREKALAAGAAAAAAEAEEAGGGGGGRISSTLSPPPAASMPVLFPVSVRGSSIKMPASALRSAGSSRPTAQHQPRSVSFADQDSSSELDYRSGHDEAREGGVGRGGIASTLRQVLTYSVKTFGWGSSRLKGGRVYNAVAATSSWRAMFPRCHYYIVS